VFKRRGTGTHGGDAKVIIDKFGLALFYYIHRPPDGISNYRYAASERLQHDDTKRIGPTGKNEYVSGCVILCQFYAFFSAYELDLRKGMDQPLELRPIAHHNL
jgi:hypothetical protein